MIKTALGELDSDQLVPNYFTALVGGFYKILPMKENGESSLNLYIKSFQTELMGCREFVPGFADNPSFLTLLAILQYFIDNPEAPVSDVKREVFKAIDLCNRLTKFYAEK